ncbi:MAG: hypothetical protein IGBAC_1096 [Ignavibacteriae bacterium]|nr:MAG: hypothetical protein IGBAC_1096 [Ignavibacteriota bacterium]
MHNLIPYKKSSDIIEIYNNTPIELLLEYHNLNKPFAKYSSAQILIGMCMDNRKKLNIPDNFAYILRTGGANLRFSEFKISYAIAIGGVKYIALIGHNNCGMVNLISKKEKFIDGLIHNAGWDKISAEEHFMQYAPMFEIEDEVNFLITEAKRLRIRYPKITIAPLLYLIEENKIYQIQEN